MKRVNHKAYLGRVFLFLLRLFFMVSDEVPDDEKHDEENKQGNSGDQQELYLMNVHGGYLTILMSASSPEKIPKYDLLSEDERDSSTGGKKRPEGDEAAPLPSPEHHHENSDDRSKETPEECGEDDPLPPDEPSDHCHHLNITASHCLFPEYFLTGYGDKIKKEEAGYCADDQSSPSELCCPQEGVRQEQGSRKKTDRDAGQGYPVRDDLKIKVYEGPGS